VSKEKAEMIHKSAVLYVAEKRAREAELAANPPAAPEPEAEPEPPAVAEEPS
jgi:hypothetical protein